MAYGLILVSFIVKQILLLRVFAVVASFSSIFYNFHIAHDPLWIPIQWNLLFITVNSYHLIMFVLAKRKIKLSDMESFVYHKHFSAITPVEFKRLLKCGHTRNYYKDQKLIEANSHLGAIFLIMEGEVNVSLHGKIITQLKKSEFIGEMSFLTGQKTRADIILSTTCKIHYWDLEELNTFFRRNPSILASFHSAIGHQLISRLLKKDDMIFEKEEISPVRKAA